MAVVPFTSGDVFLSRLMHHRETFLCQDRDQLDFAVPWTMDERQHRLRIQPISISNCPKTCRKLCSQKHITLILKDKTYTWARVVGQAFEIGKCLESLGRWRYCVDHRPCTPCASVDPMHSLSLSLQKTLAHIFFFSPHALDRLFPNSTSSISALFSHLHHVRSGHTSDVARLCHCCNPLPRATVVATLGQ